MDRDLKELAAFSDSIFKAWDIKPIFRREGGSIPIVNKFKSTLGLNSILSGFSTPDNNAHGRMKIYVSILSSKESRLSVFSLRHTQSNSFRRKFNNAK